LKSRRVYSSKLGYVYMRIESKYNESQLIIDSTIDARAYYLTCLSQSSVDQTKGTKKSFFFYSLKNKTGFLFEEEKEEAAAAEKKTK